MISNDYRADLGQTAVEEHTDLIGNGQETEPFDTQAQDAVTNILHALQREMGDAFDAEQFVSMSVIHFNSER